MSVGQSRRPLGLLIVVVVAALVVGGIVQQRSDKPATPRQELARHLDAAPSSARFSMHYDRTGTRVLDCVALNLRYTARVDTDAQRMVVTTSGLDQPSVIVESTQVLLRRSLFQHAPGQAEWLSVPRQFAAAARKTLTDVLGVDLATAVTSSRLPASGSELAAAALNIARSVRRLPPSDVDGDTVDGYRIRVSRRGYERDTLALNAEPGDTSLLPVFDVWVDADNEVRRITIGSETEHDTTGPAENGWTMDFTAARTVRRPAVGFTAPLGAADLAELRGAPQGCELPVGSGRA